MGNRRPTGQPAPAPAERWPHPGRCFPEGHPVYAVLAAAALRQAAERAAPNRGPEPGAEGER